MTNCPSQFFDWDLLLHDTHSLHSFSLGQYVLLPPLLLLLQPPPK